MVPLSVPVIFNHWDSLLSCLDALIRTEQYLLARQAPDGAWMDYPDIEVGLSLAWTTAYTGFALSLPPTTQMGTLSLARTVRYLHTLERPDGWGYNERSASDADSTAWAIRFLNRLDALRGRNSMYFLAQYTGDDGTVRTYHASDTFGIWAGHSDEVAPVVALALLETDSARESAHLISTRQFTVANAPSAPFESLWWECAEYALCWNTLLFERLSWPVPVELQTLLAQRLTDANLNDIFIISLLVLAAPAHLIRHRKDIYGTLISTAVLGKFTPSAKLLVPDQYDRNSCSRHLDTGVMTAATLLMALKKFYFLQYVG